VCEREEPILFVSKANGRGRFPAGVPVQNSVENNGFVMPAGQTVYIVKDKKK
jgi:hypothetical protein